MSNQLLLRRRMMMQSKKDNILTFTASVANSSVQLTAVGSPSAVTLEYNNGGGWLPYTVGDVISLPNVGDKVKMRGNNETFSGSSSNYYKFVIAGNVAASGDVTSLQNEIGGDIALTSNCYYSMFSGCSGLTTAPALPATTLASYCYRAMFTGCNGLTIAPALPAVTLASYCYNGMFYSCKGLTIASTLPAITLADGCYNAMFYRCLALTKAPELPATTLADGCYNNMFQDCTSITSHDVATLNNSAGVFKNNSSCASFIIHANTQPTIASDTITGLKADCKIYVPYSADHSILNAYRTAQYWSDRAEYMYELDENGEVPV